MANRTNWTAIRSYFLANETATLRDCADRFGINYGSIRQKASDQGWTRQKQQIQIQAQSRLKEKTTDLVTKKIEEELAVGQILIGKATQALASGIEPKTAAQIKSWVELGIKIQRDALGLGKQERGTNEKVSQWIAKKEPVKLFF